MTAYDPEPGHDFAVAFAGAAGALLGLAFVAISFNLDSILQSAELPRPAIETLVFFAYPLAGSLLLLVPGLTSTALGIGEGVLALGLLYLVIRDLPMWVAEKEDPLSWRLSQLAPGVLITAFAFIGAIGTMTTSIGGLYWIAAAMAVATSFGVMNSWVLLVEIKR